MLKTNFKEEFKKYCLQLESLENQRENTFDLKNKALLKHKIIDVKNEIDKILDEYNQERK